MLYLSSKSLVQWLQCTLALTHSFGFCYSYYAPVQPSDSCNNNLYFLDMESPKSLFLWTACTMIPPLFKPLALSFFYSLLFRSHIQRISNRFYLHHLLTYVFLFLLSLVSFKSLSLHGTTFWITSEFKQTNQVPPLIMHFQWTPHFLLR